MYIILSCVRNSTCKYLSRKEVAVGVVSPGMECAYLALGVTLRDPDP